MTSKLLKRSCLWTISVMAGALLGGRPSVAAEPAPSQETAGQASSATTAKGARPAEAGAPAQPGTTAQAAKEAAHVVDSRIVERLHGFNTLEIAAGKMAETHSRSTAVRDYGAMLVRDHQAADKKVIAYAKQRKIDPNAATEAVAGSLAQYRAQLDRLGLLSGATFDRGFATSMRDQQGNAIAIIERARLGVTDPKLTALISELLPMLHKHQHMAAELTGQKPTASNEPAPPAFR